MRQESHQREAIFADAKRHDRYVQSIVEGCVPAENLAPGDSDELARRKEKDAKRLLVYFQERRRKNSKLVKPQYPNFAGHFVYTHGVDTDDLFHACQRQSMRRAEDHLKASILVIPDIANIPDELVFSAMLGGKFICEAKYLVTRGDKGLSIKYTAAASVRRKVHITNDFLLHHEDACCAIMFYSSGADFVPAGSSAPGKWIFVGGRAEFLEIAENAIRRKKPTEVIAFCHDIDKDGADFRHLKLVFFRDNGSGGSC